MCDLNSNVNLRTIYDDGFLPLEVVEIEPVSFEPLGRDDDGMPISRRHPGIFAVRGGIRNATRTGDLSCWIVVRSFSRSEWHPGVGRNVSAVDFLLEAKLFPTLDAARERYAEYREIED